MKNLTQAKAQIMQALWSPYQGAYIKGILEVLAKNYFEGYYANVVSFLVDKKTYVHLGFGIALTTT